MRDQNADLAYQLPPCVLSENEAEYRRERRRRPRVTWARFVDTGDTESFFDLDAMPNYGQMFFAFGNGKLRPAPACVDRVLTGIARSAFRIARLFRSRDG